MRGDKRFIDCNEFTWQVALMMDGEYVHYSARSAATLLAHETDLWNRPGRGDHDKAAKLRHRRQTGKF